MAAKKRERPSTKQSFSREFQEEGAMSKDLTQYVTTKQAAEMLGVDPSQAARLVRDGKVKGIKLGHDWLVFAPSIEHYLATKPPGGRPPSRKPKSGSSE